MALSGAVAFDRERGPAFDVALGAGSLFLLGALVHRAELEVQRGLGILGPEGGVAGLAIVLLALGMRGVIVRDLAILGGEFELGGRRRRLLLLGERARESNE